MKRFLFTIKFLSVLLLLDACLKCDEVEPFFDYGELSFGYRNGVTMPRVDQEFTIMVYTEKLVFLANETRSFDLISSSAMAREKCDVPGNRGDKYPLDSVHVKSSADWDGNHPAGKPLNDIVFIEEWWAGVRQDYPLLSEMDGFSLKPRESTAFHFRTPPSESLKHVFQVIYYKSNGEMVEGFTDTITWVP